MRRTGEALGSGRSLRDLSRRARCERDFLFAVTGLDTQATEASPAAELDEPTAVER